MEQVDELLHRDRTLRSAGLVSFVWGKLKKRHFMWYRNLGETFFRFVTIQTFDGRTDGRTDGHLAHG